MGGNCMTVEGSLSFAMRTLSSLYAEQTGGALAIKVLKDQMDQQQQLISTLTQSSQLVASEAYDSNGKALGASVHPTVDRRV
jgi:hypothetical protein